MRHTSQSFAFTTIQFPGSGFTNALGINNRGQVVGGYAASVADVQRQPT
jgi:hypothetical protein